MRIWSEESERLPAVIGKSKETDATWITFSKAGRLPHVVSLGFGPRDAELCGLEVALWVVVTKWEKQKKTEQGQSFKLWSFRAQASTNAMGYCCYWLVSSETSWTWAKDLRLHTPAWLVTGWMLPSWMGHELGWSSFLWPKAIPVKDLDLMCFPRPTDTLGRWKLSI